MRKEGDTQVSGSPKRLHLIRLTGGLLIALNSLLCPSALGQYSLSMTFGEIMPTFDRPVSMAIDREGNVFGLDDAAGQILKYNPNGEILAEFGKGVLTGSVIDIACDNEGFLFVLGKDVGYKFNARGELLSEFGRTLSEGFQFGSPLSLALHGEQIYIADKQYQIDDGVPGVNVFDLEGNHLRTIGVKLQEQMDFDPNFFSGIAIDFEGYIYLSGIEQNIVYKLDTQGKIRGRLGRKGGLARPTGIAAGKEGNVYVANGRTGDIAVFDAKGKLANRFDASRAREKGLGVRLFGLKADGDDNLYAADIKNRRILKFSPQGQYLASFSPKPSPDHLRSPGAIAVDQQGNLYISDTKNQKIRKYDRDGALLMSFGEENLTEPRGMALDRKGNILVCDQRKNVIRIFNPEGVYVKSFGRKKDSEPNTARMHGPVDIIVDEQGTIFVLQYGYNSGILEFTPELDWVRKMDIRPKGSLRFFAIDSAGQFYVTDNGLRKFARKGYFMKDFSAWNSDAFGPDDVPKGVHVDDEGKIWVISSKNGGRVMHFDQEGNLILNQDSREIAPGMNCGWFDLAVREADGAVYTINMPTNQILQLNRTKFEER